jgi:ribosomal protein L21E
MAYTQQEELERIRHYVGTLSDFKNFFDQKAAETAKKDEANTNSYGTPHYQGFNDVHPTRGANASPHWEESVNLEEKKNENPFKKGDKVIVDKIVGMTHAKQSDARRFNGKKGTVIGTQGNYVYVNLKGFRSPEIEFATHELKLDESNSTSTKADRLPLFQDFQG